MEAARVVVGIIFRQDIYICTCVCSHGSTHVWQRNSCGLRWCPISWVRRDFTITAPHRQLIRSVQRKVAAFPLGRSGHRMLRFCIFCCCSVHTSSAASFCSTDEALHCRRGRVVITFRCSQPSYRPYSAVDSAPTRAW
jgi:hypothetical protein